MQVKIHRIFTTITPSLGLELLLASANRRKWKEPVDGIAFSSLKSCEIKNINIENENDPDIQTLYEIYI